MGSMGGAQGARMGHGMDDGHDAVGHGTGGMHGSGSVGGMASMHEMMGMHGMHRMHGAAHDMHGMHGAAMGVPASTVASLARAFLAGRGLEAGDVVVNGPRITYEATYRSGDAEGVLLIDALTGEVVEATAR